MEKIETLIIDDEEDIRDIVEMSLTGFSLFNMSHAESGQDAISKIKQNTYDLIICDFNMANGSGGDVYKFLLENHILTKYVLCSSDLPTKHSIFSDTRYLFHNIEKPNISKGINELVQKLMAFKEVIINIAIDYEAIPTRIIYKIGTTPCDVFIKINDNKFVKILKKGEALDEADYVKYEQKQLKNFYLESKSVEEFKKEFESNVFRKLSLQDTSDSGVFSISSGINLLNSYVCEYGFNHNISRAIEDSSRTMAEIVSKNRQLDILFKKLFDNNESYIAKHSILLSVFAPLLARQLKWSNRIMNDKLVIASLFHDITLRVDQIESVDFDKLLASENFLSHSIEASEIIMKIEGIPPDTHVIILEHHEGGEKGIPRSFPYSKVSPLGLLFSFCHIFVDELILSSSIDVAMDKTHAKSNLCSQYKVFYKSLEELDLF